MGRNPFRASPCASGFFVMINLPEHIVRHAPWSISKIGVIEKCSQQFAFKYGANKIKELKVFHESKIGIAVHTVLELALAGNPVNVAFIHGADQADLTHQEREQLESFRDQVESFVEKMRVFQHKHRVTQKFIEADWAIKPDFTSTHFFDKTGLLRGKVDFAMLTAANDLIIIDHKSGQEKDISAYDAQFKSYCLLAIAKYPNIRGVQTAINFTQPDKMVWNTYVSAETIRAEYPLWLADYLTTACSKLTSPPTTSVGWWCDWCGFKPVCKAHGGNGASDEDK